MSTTVGRQAKLGLLEAGIETTFGTETVSYAPMRTTDPAILTGLEWPAIENGAVRAHGDGIARIPGAKTGKLTTKHLLHGWSTETVTSAPSMTSHPLAHALAMAFGWGAAGGYVSQDPAGSTTSAIKGADLASFVIGQALGWPTAANGYQVGWAVNNVAGTTDEITLLQTAPAAPSANPSKIYGSMTFAVTDGYDYVQAGVLESFTLRYTTAAGEERYTCVGCRPSKLTLTMDAGQVPTLTIEWGVAAWSCETSVTAPVEQAYAYPEPTVLTGAWVAWGADAGASRVRVAKMEFDLGLDSAATPDVGAAQGIGGWVVKGRKPTLKFSVYRNVATEVDDWAAQTPRTFSVVMGSAPGAMAALVFPAARVVEYPKWADEDGIVSSPIVLEACSYTGDTGTRTETDLLDKSCKFALL